MAREEDDYPGESLLSACAPAFDNWVWKNETTQVLASVFPWPPKLNIAAECSS